MAEKSKLSDLIAKRQKQAKKKRAPAKKPGPNKAVMPNAKKAAKKATQKKPGATAKASKNKDLKSKPARKGATVPVPVESPIDSRWAQFASNYAFGRPPDVPQWHATAAYMSVYTDSTEAAAADSAHKLLRKPEFKRILNHVAGVAWERNNLTEDRVIQAWLALSDANLLDYFEAHDAPDDRPGHLMLTARQLKDMPRAIQQNIKKLKIRTTWYPSLDAEGNETQLPEQVVEIEIFDRTKVLKDMANFLGMFQEDLDDDNVSKIAEAIARGQERAKRRTVVWNSETQRPEYPDEE